MACALRVLTCLVAAHESLGRRVFVAPGVSLFARAPQTRWFAGPAAQRSPCARSSLGNAGSPVGCQRSLGLRAVGRFRRPVSTEHSSQAVYEHEKSVSAALNTLAARVGARAAAGPAMGIGAAPVSSRAAGRLELAAQSRRQSEGRALARPPIDESIEVQFDPNSVIDMTEKALVGSTFCLTSSVFGFPDFKSLIELRIDGSVFFYGGMVSSEPGAWCVVEGDPRNGERPNDLFIEFTQPLTKVYIEAFTVPGGTAFWRGKLRLPKEEGGEVLIEGGAVTSERDERTKLVREGVFSARSVDEEAALEVQRRSAQAFDRALTTPKAESSGFKTPARIAGINPRKPRRQLGAGKGRDDEDRLLLEDDA